MKHFRYSLVLLLAVGALATRPALAQSSAGSPPSGGPTPTTTPIDGGASLLLASGLALGLRKLRQRRAR